MVGEMIEGLRFSESDTAWLQIQIYLNQEYGKQTWLNNVPDVVFCLFLCCLTKVSCIV